MELIWVLGKALGIPCHSQGGLSADNFSSSNGTSPRCHFWPALTSQLASSAPPAQSPRKVRLLTRRQHGPSGMVGCASTEALLAVAYRWATCWLLDTHAGSCLSNQVALGKHALCFLGYVPGFTLFSPQESVWMTEGD